MKLSLYIYKCWARQSVSAKTLPPAHRRIVGDPSGATVARHIRAYVVMAAKEFIHNCAVDRRHMRGALHLERRRTGRHASSGCKSLSIRGQDTLILPKSLHVLIDIPTSVCSVEVSFHLQKLFLSTRAESSIAPSRLHHHNSRCFFFHIASYTSVVIDIELLTALLSYSPCVLHCCHQCVNHERLVLKKLFTLSTVGMAEKTRLQSFGLLTICVGGIYASYLTQGKWRLNPLPACRSSPERLKEGLSAIQGDVQ